jgi:hypothetical protein
MPHTTPQDNSVLSSYTSKKQDCDLACRESNRELSEGKSNLSPPTKTIMASYQVSLSREESHLSQSGGAMTYSRLSQHYQFSSLTVRAPVDVAPVAETQPLLAGAANILSFIEQRLSSEKAAGASADDLQSFLDQGLKGFKQGYAEAETILGDTGKLSDVVTNTISTLYQQVMEGFDHLYNKYLGSSGPETQLPAVTDNAAAVSTVVQAPRQFLSSVNQPVSAGEQFTMLGNNSHSALSSMIDSISDVSQLANTQIEYGRKDRFSFELTTLEGDKITIKASSTSIFVGEYSHRGLGSSDALEGTKEKNRFSIGIEGNLNEQEVKAIDDLLQQIMSLADEFYNGDINKAYESAINLGYDQNEIASYSLKLRQTQQLGVTAAYQQWLPPSEAVASEQIDALNTISDYARSVIDTLNNPAHYQIFDYSQLLRGISEQIDAQIKPLNTSGFHDAIAALVDHMQVLNTMPHVSTDSDLVP